MSAPRYYLPEGLPMPVPEADGLSAPYWAGLREERLLVQHCGNCGTWQFGPEWICHRCHAFDPAWEAIEASGRIFSWERVWHPSHAALKGHGPYLAVLVELPHAGGVRMVGNLLGDPMQEIAIGAAVVGVYEHHHAGSPERSGPTDSVLAAARSFTLLHWRLRS